MEILVVKNYILDMLVEESSKMWLLDFMILCRNKKLWMLIFTVLVLGSSFEEESILC